MDFHETGLGRSFFQRQLPRLIAAIEENTKAINRQAAVLEKQSELMENAMLGIPPMFAFDENSLSIFDSPFDPDYEEEVVVSEEEEPEAEEEPQEDTTTLAGSETAGEQ